MGEQVGFLSEQIDAEAGAALVLLVHTAVPLLPARYRARTGTIRGAALVLLVHTAVPLLPARYRARTGTIRGAALVWSGLVWSGLVLISSKLHTYKLYSPFLPLFSGEQLCKPTIEGN